MRQIWGTKSESERLEMIHILVVDDEPGIRQTLAGVLEDEGYRVTGAEDGESGLDLMRDQHLSAIDHGEKQHEKYEHHQRAFDNALPALASLRKDSDLRTSICGLHGSRSPGA